MAKFIYSSLTHLPNIKVAATLSLVHSSQILDVLVREGVLLSLGADGLLK